MYREISIRSEKEKVVEYFFNKKRKSMKSFWSIFIVRNMNYRERSVRKQNMKLMSLVSCLPICYNDIQLYT